MAGRNSVDIHTNLEYKAAQENLHRFETEVKRVTGNEYVFKLSIRKDGLNNAKAGIKSVQQGISGIQTGLATLYKSSGYASQAMGKAKAGAKQFAQEVRDLKNDTGVFGAEVRSTNKAVTQLNKSMSATTTAKSKAARQTKQLTDEEKAHNEALQNGNRILSRAQSLITGFAMGAYVAGIRNALVELRNVDTELVTIQKVTGQTRQEVQALADESYTTAAKYGAIASDYLSSVASFARAGYGENAQALGELSLMTQKVGDVNAETADQFLLSVDAAYQYKGSIESLTKVLDGANEIGNKFATDVNKITAGLGIVSNVAKQANVDIDEVTAALATITAVTQRSGSEAARALRAIYLNIAADISTEIDEDTGDHWTAEEIEAMSTSLQKFGIYTRYAKDGVEQLRNPMEVIGEISEKVKSGIISEVELNDLLQGLGGKLRSNQLLALINNWDMYENMLDTYRTAAGSAEDELAIYLDSWEAKAAKLQATWTELVNKSLNSETIKRILDLGTAFLEASDNLGVLTLSLSGFLALINANKIVSIGNGIGGLAKSIGGVFTGSAAAVGGVGVFGLALTALSAFVTWIGYLKDKEAEAKQEIYDASHAIQTNREEADKAYRSYKDLYDKLKSVKGITGELAEEDQAKLAESAKNVAAAFGIEDSVIDALTEKLGDYNLAVETAVENSKLEALPKEIEESESAIEKALDDILEKRKSSPLYSFSNSVALGLDSIFGGIQPNGERNLAVEAERELVIYDQLIQRKAELIALNKTDTEEYKSVQASIDGTKESIDIITEALFNEKRALYEQKNGIIDTREEYEKFVLWLKGEGGSALKFKPLVSDDPISQGLQTNLLHQLENNGNFVEELNPISKALVKLAGDLYDFTDAAEEANQALEETPPKAEESAKILGALSETFTDLQAKYTSLNEIAEAYNGTGRLTAEQFKAITEGGLLQYLEFVDGELRINEEALYDNAEAAKASAIEQLRASYAADILALQEGRVSDMSAGAQTAMASAGDSAISSGEKALAAASDWTALGSAINYAAEAAMGDGAHSVDYWIRENGNDALNKYYNQAVDAIKALDFDTATRKSGGSGGGGGGSRSTSTSEKVSSYIDVLKSLLNDADYQIEMWTRDGNKEDAIIAMYQRMQKEIESVRQRYLDQGYDETSDEIQELTKLWWKYADAIEDVHEDLAKRVQDTWNELENQVGDMVDERTDALEDQIDALEDQYKGLLDDLKTAYDAQVDALEEARDAEEERLELEERRLAVLEAEQNLLNAQNDRTVRKYNADGSWEWVADQRAIQTAEEALTSARQNLADYEAELELNATKEALKAEYEANKAALEAERDEQIARVQAEKDAFESEWDAITEAIKEPGRDIAEILSEIATNGTPAMKEQVDNITALLGKLGYDVAAVAGTKYGGGGVTSSDSAQIKKMLTGDYSSATFDNGGVAGIKGIMLKNTAEAETVLPPSLTKAIISPQRNAQFSAFTDALTKMFGMAEYRASGTGTITRNYGNTDSHDTTYSVNGVNIGWAQAQRPFYEVMRDIVVYTNPA